MEMGYTWVQYTDAVGFPPNPLNDKHLGNDETTTLDFQSNPTGKGEY